MAARDIYETSFDEDIQTNSSTNLCPECDGRVTDDVEGCPHHTDGDRFSTLVDFGEGYTELLPGQYPASVVQVPANRNISLSGCAKTLPPVQCINEKIR